MVTGKTPATAIPNGFPPVQVCPLTADQGHETFPVLEGELVLHAF